MDFEDVAWIIMVIGALLFQGFKFLMKQRTAKLEREATAPTRPAPAQQPSPRRPQRPRPASSGQQQPSLFDAIEDTSAPQPAPAPARRAPSGDDQLVKLLQRLGVEITDEVADELGIAIPGQAAPPPQRPREATPPPRPSRRRTRPRAQAPTLGKQERTEPISLGTITPQLLRDALVLNSSLGRRHPPG